MLTRFKLCCSWPASGRVPLNKADTIGIESWDYLFIEDVATNEGYARFTYVSRFPVAEQCSSSNIVIIAQTGQRLLEDLRQVN